MNTEHYIELGFAIAVAGAMIRYLMVSATRQRVFLQNLVSNHLTHNTEALLRLESAIQRLTDTLDKR